MGYGRTRYESILTPAPSPDFDPVFYYYHPDHLGSTTIMTDREGDIIQHYGNTPFGKEHYKHNTDAFAVSNRYTSQIIDEATGLYYYNARYYDPELARFIQADTILPGLGSQSLNRYTYVNNNPLIYTDPSGNFLLEAALFAAAVSAGTAAAQGARGSEIWKAAAAGAVIGAFGYIGSTGGFWGTVISGAAGGALGAEITGADTSAGVWIGLATASFGYSFGLEFEAFKYKIASAEWIKRVGASMGINGLVGGVVAEATGGKFKDGFRAGATSAASWGIIGSSLYYIASFGVSPTKDDYAVLADLGLTKEEWESAKASLKETGIYENAGKKVMVINDAYLRNMTNDSETYAYEGVTDNMSRKEIFYHTMRNWDTELFADKSVVPWKTIYHNGKLLSPGEVNYVGVGSGFKHWGIPSPISDIVTQLWSITGIKGVTNYPGRGPGTALGGYGEIPSWGKQYYLGWGRLHSN